MAKAIGRAVGRSVRVVPTPAWLFMKAARMSGYPIDLLSGVRYYIDDHKRGAFELGAPTTDVLDVTGRPAEDFETIARRYAALPRNQRTFGNWLREFAQFMVAPLNPGFNLDRYDRELRRPFPSQPQFATGLQGVAARARHRRRRQARAPVQAEAPSRRHQPRSIAGILNKEILIMPQQMICFFVSIAFSFIAWGIVASRYIWPELRLRQRAEALRPLLILHSFRFIGLAFLVPGVVSPDLPSAFAHSAAYGDIIAAILALLSLLSLPRAAGVVVAWIFNLWGTADILNAFYQANHAGLLAGQLGAAYFIPTFDCAAAADHARTRFPDSSATSK